MNQPQYHLHPIWQVITPGEVAQSSVSLPRSLGEFLAGGHPTKLEVLAHEEGQMALGLSSNRRRTARRRLPARRLRRG